MELGLWDAAVTSRLVSVVVVLTTEVVTAVSVLLATTTTQHVNVSAVPLDFVSDGRFH